MSYGLFLSLNFASKILRSPLLLKTLSRPVGVRPGAGEYDKLGRMFEVTYETLGQVSARETQGFGTLTDTAVSNITQQPKDQPSNIVPTQPTSRMQQATAQLNVSPPSAASSAGGINPLLVPNPTTRATFGSP